MIYMNSQRNMNEPSHCLFPAGSFMLKVNNRNTRTKWEICLKLTIKASEFKFIVSLVQGRRKLFSVGGGVWGGGVCGWNLILNLWQNKTKTIVPRPATLFKMRLQHRCFFYEIWEIFKNTFLRKQIPKCSSLVVSVNSSAMIVKYFVFWISWLMDGGDSVNFIFSRFGIHFSLTFLWLDLRFRLNCLYSQTQKQLFLILLFGIWQCLKTVFHHTKIQVFLLQHTFSQFCQRYKMELWPSG